MRPLLIPTLARVALVAAGAACAVGANAAGDKAAYESAKAAAQSSYEAAFRNCDATKGNAHDICVAEAKAARVKAEQQAEAAYQGTPKARAKAAEEIAEANYRVARERCDDRTGNDKDVCIKVVKAELTKAKADAKARRKTSEARQEAAKEKREADYNVAAQKCEALAGDARSACVKDAKTRYGM